MLEITDNNEMPISSYPSYFSFSALSCGASHIEILAELSAIFALSKERIFRLIKNGPKNVQ